jgi:hypothetical protein
MRTAHISWVGGTIQGVQEQARSWRTSQALRALVAAMGGPSANSDDLVAWSSHTLDTRGGGERRDARPTTWDDDITDALVAAAGPLGLLATAQPSLPRYECALLLGGATTGNELRTAYVDELLKTGVALDEIAGLAAYRPLGPSEQTDALTGEGIDNEWTHLRRCLAANFGPLRSERSASGGEGVGRWVDQQFQGAVGVPIRLLVAPSSSSARANTADAIVFFMERHRKQLPRHLLIVTSAIYVPYQFFAVAGTFLAEGIPHVEFVGTHTSTTGDRALLAQRVAQEIQAAIGASERLLGD